MREASNLKLMGIEKRGKDEPVYACIYAAHRVSYEFKGEISIEMTGENHLLDFYFSPKQYSLMQRMSFGERGNQRTLFAGKIYTECVDHGKKPGGVWDDYKLIGTGTDADIKIQIN